MKFIEVTEKQFVTFYFNDDNNIIQYGASDSTTHKIYNSENECIAIRLFIGNQNCYIREDYVKYCNM